MDTRRVMDAVYTLAAEIGARPSGSEANHRAAAYIAAGFRAAGLEVEEQRWECPAWEEGETVLEIDGVRAGAMANAYSRPCDVSAPTVAVGSVAELESAQIDGKVVVLYGDLVRTALSAKSWFLRDERDARIVELLETGRPAAVITIQTRQGSVERLIEDWEFEIPSATVPADVGLTLLRTPGAAVRLGIASRRWASWSCNVVGRAPASTAAPEGTGSVRDGPERAGEAGRIVLCAHYDTKVDTPGATDNATGVAALLALAAELAKRPQAYGLEFVAFSGEEYLPMGDDEYVRRAGDDGFGKMVAAINFDGLGSYLSSSSLAIFVSSGGFEEAVRDWALAYPGIVWVEPWPQSNHSTFAWRGVPCLAFSSIGVTVAHQREDTAEAVSPARIEEAVSLAADVVAGLQAQPFDWARPGEEGA